MAFDPKFKTLIDIYESSTKKYAKRELFGVKKGGTWKWMTYGEFREQVEAVRGGLAKRGVQKGDRVAVIADNRPEWAIAAYATYGLGAAVRADVRVAARQGLEVHPSRLRREGRLRRERARFETRRRLLGGAPEPRAHGGDRREGRRRRRVVVGPPEGGQGGPCAAR